MTRIAWLVVLLAGCADPAAIDPADIHAGIYTLHISTRADTCEPRRPSGDFGAVFAGGTGHTVSAIDPDGRQGYSRYELSDDDGYVTSWGPLIQLGCGDARFATTRQLISATTDDFVVNATTDWTVPGPCPDGSIILDMPTATCRANQDQIYHLVTVCDAPCTVRQAPTEQPVCVCP